MEEHAFIDAAKTCDWHTVRRMAMVIPALINTMPGGRWSALHHAARAGDATMVSWLLARGADPEARTPQGQRPRDVATAAASEVLASGK